MCVLCTFVTLSVATDCYQLIIRSIPQLGYHMTFSFAHKSHIQTAIWFMGWEIDYRPIVLPASGELLWSDAKCMT